ncbi:MAG: hypothetical protein QM811_05620 [Pirellulales bacterium]
MGDLARRLGRRRAAGSLRVQGWFVWSSLRYLMLVVLRLHRHMPDCRSRTLAGVRFTIEGDGATPIPYQIDGDPGGTLPATVRVLPGRFRAIVSDELLRKLSLAAE